MDDALRKIAEQALHEIPLTRLGDVARMIRPYRVYAHYGVLYQMAMDGDLPIVRDQRRRIWVIGEPEEIARWVEQRLSYKNGHWRPLRRLVQQEGSNLP